jgi:hypothetical protein
MTEDELRNRHRAEGKIKGMQESLLTLLEARGFAVTARQRARILACKDLEVLRGWIIRTAPITSTGDVLGRDEPSGVRRTRAQVPPKRATTRRAAAGK